MMKAYERMDGKMDGYAEKREKARGIFSLVNCDQLGRKHVSR